MAAENAALAPSGARAADADTGRPGEIGAR